ncbi:hypothetical protein ACFQ7B_33650 [Streptomyces erythrochromogenes]|uniref:hypothetical protein n=1 Tax=Streptomyces erythrochromogenes TaxID=285574 RepID=UPI0036839F5F
MQTDPAIVSRNAKGIAAALDDVTRMEFFRQLLAAEPDDIEQLMRRWWAAVTVQTSLARETPERASV